MVEPNNTPDVDARDYLAEALAIATGKTRLMPQVEHLKALILRLAEAEQQRNLVTISHVATMLGNGLPTALKTPAEFAFDIAAQEIGLEIGLDEEKNIIARIHAPRGLRRPRTPGTPN